MSNSLDDHQVRDLAFWEALLTSKVPEIIESASPQSLVFVGTEVRTMDHPVVHNHPELAFVLEGTLEMVTSSRRISVGVGDIIVVAPWMYHQPVPTSSYTRILWIAFKQTHLGIWIVRRTQEKPAAIDEERGIDMIRSTQEYELVYSVTQELLDLDTEWLSVVKNTLSTLMIRIRRCILEKGRLEGDRDRTSRTDTLVMAAQDYIERHYNHEISIVDVAHYVALSANYFANLFKKRTGETIGDYITTVRMREARRLLRDSDLMVSEIAYKVGYRSPYYFSRVFRQSLEQSPSAYRDSFGLKNKEEP